MKSNYEGLLYNLDIADNLVSGIICRIAVVPEWLYMLLSIEDKI